MEQTTSLQPRRAPGWVLAVIFSGLWVLALMGMALRAVNYLPDAAFLQKALYVLLGSLLLAGTATFAVAALFGSRGGKTSRWACPLAAGGLSLALYMIAYIFLGVWPVGDKSIMVVDMHHQYAPLLSELRDMLRSGSGFTYSFHVGLGGNFIPTFAYYLASPLNLLLLLFPENLLTEGILVITLIKGAATAASFAACAQYVARYRGAGVVACSVLYALSGYMLAYSWNIMWLDVVALLPVVVLCMEHMLRTGKIIPYTLTLALALFVNYYIGFMLCVFLVLYMAVWVLRERHTGREFFAGCGRFAFGSLLAGGLAAALLVPTALALGRTSAAGGELGDFSSNFPLFDLVGRMLFGASPTIRSGNLPNLYCGLPAVILLPLYLANKDIPVRRRLTYGGLLTVLLLSCTLTQVDLLWHGLHAPNDLPYRFSFLVGFVLLLMAAQVMANPAPVTPRQVVASLAGCATYLVLWERLDGETAPAPIVLYTNLLLLAVYGAVLLLGALRRIPRPMTARLLLVVVCLELAIGAGDTLEMVDSNEYYTLHDNYVDNVSTELTAEAVRAAQALGKEEMGEDFFRLEYLPRSTCMDTALHHYAGMTTFASSNPYQTTLFMGELGYAVNGVNSYLYHSFVPATDSLFGIRYVILGNNISNHAQLEKVSQVTLDGQTKYIYRNELALPLAYMADTNVASYRGTKYDPFGTQEQLYAALTGEWSTLYEQMELEGLTDGASLNSDTAFYIPGGDTEEEFIATVETAGQYFAYVDCRAADDITVLSYTAEGSPQNTWNVVNHEPYIIDMGTLSVGQTVQVWVESDTAATGNIYLVRLDTAAMEDKLEALREGGLTVTSMTETTIEGTVTAKEDGALVVTVPYDKGWTVTVDGKAVDTFPLASTMDGTDGALLCANVPGGQHTVVLTYTAPGQMLGILISLGSLVALGLVWIVSLAVERRKANTPIPVIPVETEQPESPAPPVELPGSLEELLELPEEELPDRESLTELPTQPILPEEPLFEEAPPAEGGLPVEEKPLPEDE